MGDEEPRTLRRSRRVAARKRKGKRNKHTRVSVGAALGLTPGKSRARNLAEAKALERAVAAASARHGGYVSDPGSSAEGDGATKPRRR